MNWKKSLSAALLAAFAASPAYAHTGGAAHGLTAGLLHPLSGLDHLLAMLAVGVLAVRPQEKTRWSLPLLFAGWLALGALVGIFGGALPGVEFMVAGSVVLMGALLAWGRQMAAPALFGMIALSALMHGQAHGAEVSGAWFTYLAGMTSTTLALHLSGAWAGQRMARFGALPARVYGTATLGLGLVLFAGLF